MRLLHFRELSLELPGRTLLDHITWSIFRGERYGLVGPNGAGKTTILRLIARQADPSAGGIERCRDLTVGYLPQDGVAHVGHTLFEEAWSGLPDLPHLQIEIEKLREDIAKVPDDLDLVEEMGALQHRWEDLEGYHAEAKVARVLSGLGFSEDDFSRQTGDFPAAGRCVLRWQSYCSSIRTCCCLTNRPTILTYQHLSGSKITCAISQAR